MKIQDLVKMKDRDSDKRSRTTGIILKLDWHNSLSSAMILIAEVLWDSGPGWIDSSRIECIEGSLTDTQLESVCGGMSPEQFEVWKVFTINSC